MTTHLKHINRFGQKTPIDFSSTRQRFDAPNRKQIEGYLSAHRPYQFATSSRTFQEPRTRSIGAKRNKKRTTMCTSRTSLLRHQRRPLISAHHIDRQGPVERDINITEAITNAIPVDSSPVRRTFDINPPFSGDFIIRLRVLTNLGSDYDTTKEKKPRLVIATTFPSSKKREYATACMKNTKGIIKTAESKTSLSS